MKGNFLLIWEKFYLVLNVITISHLSEDNIESLEIKNQDKFLFVVAEMDSRIDNMTITKDNIKRKLYYGVRFKYLIKDGTYTSEALRYQGNLFIELSNFIERINKYICESDLLA